jgi:endonuclease V-like protein UPF0215 family
VLGVDDGPFEKGQPGPVPLVAVSMEGRDLVEAVAFSEFPVDGGGATAFLADWVASLRARDALHAVVLGGITLAGLGIVDVTELSERLGLAVLAVTRRDSGASELEAALRAAGLEDRIALVTRSPRAEKLGHGLYAALAGIAPAPAGDLLRAVTRKGHMPEPLRLAHLIARARVRGESRGRV